MHVCPCKGHHVDVCFKTDLQLGQRHNATISEGNTKDQYGPLSSKDTNNEHDDLNSYIL